LKWVSCGKIPTTDNIMAVVITLNPPVKWNGQVKKSLNFPVYLRILPDSELGS